MNYVYIEGEIKKKLTLRIGKEKLYVKFYVEVEIPNHTSVIEIMLGGHLLQYALIYDVGYRVKVEGHISTLVTNKDKGGIKQYIVADTISRQAI